MFARVEAASWSRAGRTVNMVQRGCVRTIPDAGATPTGSLQRL